MERYNHSGYQRHRHDEQSIRPRGRPNHAKRGRLTIHYYAKNIVAAGANANTVSVTFSSVGGHDPDIRIAEYSVLIAAIPLIR